MSLIVVVDGGAVALVQPDILRFWDALMQHGFCNSEAYRLTVAHFPEVILPIRGLNL